MTMPVYDLKGWSPPEDCAGCEFYPERSIISLRCPVHGAESGPTMNVSDWPPFIAPKAERS